ncbi:hypothetical protein [Nonomuraea sp. NPDC003804]|uniref:hypothetical protein n=1 Tax=Nonomuraea sp. NPDC003804 TaxID=3154547 RepID=UPI0033B84A04
MVNVGQRSSLYRTIDRLLAGGLVAVKETERDQLYPERTVYEITDAGGVPAAARRNASSDPAAGRPAPGR